MPSKSCRYEKRESTKDGLTKRQIVEEANRKNVSNKFRRSHYGNLRYSIYTDNNNKMQ